jgi:hypothetical protein
LIDLGKERRRDTMLEYNKNFYNIMFGNIDEELQKVAESCISSCRGCMCNCKCTCSGGYVEEFEWEGF